MEIKSFVMTCELRLKTWTYLYNTNPEPKLGQTRRPRRLHFSAVGSREERPRSTDGPVIL